MEPTRYSLDGTWTFYPTVTRDGEDISVPDESGTSIEVPGEWELQGQSVPSGEEAAYRRTVTVPDSWDGATLKLRFGAVYSHAEVYWNGERIGTHSGGFTPFEFDVTDAVEVGSENTITVVVTAETVADELASGSQYAAHSLGGIIRSVDLFAVPQQHLTQFHPEPVLDGGYSSGFARCTVSVRNQSDEPATDLELHWTVTGPGGEEITTADTHSQLSEIPDGDERTTTIELPVDDPELWSPEWPQLYTITCELCQGEQVLERVEERIGFKEITATSDELCLNGEPIRLRGVCRHEIHPTRGRSVPDELAETDAQLFNDCNVNYVRAVHYPPSEAFLDACDEQGLLVQVEAPFSWIGREEYADIEYARSEEHRDSIVRPIEEMVARDRNHPAVLSWSLANESEWGENFEAAANAVRALDSTRPLTFNWIDYTDEDSEFCELGVHHYPGPDELSVCTDADRPVVLDEYCHLNTYNRRELITDPGVRDFWGRGLESMWDAIRQTEGCVGGALWSGIDDVFYTEDADPYIGYGEWGVIDAWRRPKPEYWHVKKVYSPVDISLVAEDDDSVTVQIENGYTFTDLDRCSVQWTMGDSEGVLRPEIPPGENDTWQIEKSAERLSELSITVYDPHERLVDEFVLSLGDEQTREPNRTASTTATRTTTDTSNEQELRLSTDRTTIEIDSETGQITAGRVDGALAIHGGPWLTITPLQDDIGDYFSSPPRPLTGDPEAGTAPDLRPLNGQLAWQLDELTSETGTDSVDIRCVGETEYAHGAIGYTLSGDTRLRIEYEFTIKKAINPREFGLAIAVPQSCTQLSWNRDGYWSSYPSDHIGRQAGKTEARGHTRSGQQEPTWAWAEDHFNNGANDFRATKFYIEDASLRSADGSGVTIESDGTQHVRSWVDDESTKLLIAEHSNGGADPFFRPHIEAYQNPLQDGDVISGSVLIDLHPRT